MKYAGHKYPASAALSALIEYIYTISIPDHAEAQLYHIAPSLERMIVFNFGSTYQCAAGPDAAFKDVSARVVILGPVRQMFNALLTPGSDLLVCCFINDGFYRLESSIGSSKLLDELNVLWSALKEVFQDEDRIDVLNAYLLTHAASSDPEVHALVDSITEIHHSSLNPVDVVAAKASVSSRTVQMRFKKYAGYSSKALLRYLRFKRLIAWLVVNHASEFSWMELVLRFGYHDQSHMIKDFRYFTGLSPNKLLQLFRQENLCLSRDYLEHQVTLPAANQEID